MIVPSVGEVKIRSIVASLALGLLLLPGCGQEEATSSSPKAPPNPSPRADLGRTVEPKFPRTGEGRGPEGPSKVEQDLHKDLASPVITPDVPATPAAPPAGKPGQP